MHPGKKQQKRRCFQLLKGTLYFLRRYFIAASLNFSNASRVVGDPGTKLEPLSLEGACCLSACDHKECGASPGPPTILA
jgi:hypothetical protein